MHSLHRWLFLLCAGQWPTWSNLTLVQEVPHVSLEELLDGRPRFGLPVLPLRRSAFAMWRQNCTEGMGLLLRKVAKQRLRRYQPSGWWFSDAIQGNQHIQQIDASYKRVVFLYDWRTSCQRQAYTFHYWVLLVPIEEQRHHLCQDYFTNSTFTYVYLKIM